MDTNNYFIKELKRLKANFTDLDKRFLHVLLLDVVLIALVVAGAYVWREAILSMISEMSNISSQVASINDIASTFALQTSDTATVKIATKIVTFSILLAIYLLLAWSVMKNLAYNAVNRIRLEWPAALRTYWRFLVMTMIWGAVVVLLFLIIQSILMSISYATFDTSFLTRILDAAVIAIVVLVFYYWTITYFTYLVKTSRIWLSLKLWARTGIKKFHHFLFPLLLALIVLVLVNLVAFLFTFFKRNVFTVAMSVLMLLYLIWTRFYFTGLVYKLAPRSSKKAQQRPAAPSRKTHSRNDLSNMTASAKPRRSAKTK